MTLTRLTVSQALRRAVARATLAPSVHNSQPWSWRIGPRGVDLSTDATRRLPRTDPDGRDQVMSCGAALHHLLVALADAGQGARVRRMPDPTRPHHLATIDKYTTLAAEQWAAEGRRASALAAIVHAKLAFLRNYILRRGFADGSPGLLVSVLNSYYVFLKYVKLWEREHRGTAVPSTQGARVSPPPAESSRGASTR